VLGPDTAAERARRDLYAAATDPEPTRPAVDFETLVAERGFDAAWIAEQARRGFVARKPGADGGPETITVTKRRATGTGCSALFLTHDLGHNPADRWACEPATQPHHPESTVTGHGLDAMPAIRFQGTSGSFAR
jgi:hypothetical protein